MKNNLATEYINRLLLEIPLDTMMLNEKHVHTILGCMLWVLEKGIPGDIVELGCNAGNMAIYGQQMAQLYGRKYHAYDSFEGLPPHTNLDEAPERTAQGGDLAVSQEQFEAYFVKNGIQLPVIHKGWFHQQQYPRQIAFAFFDGDFYNSILTSWLMVYPKLAPGAMVCVHDYGFAPLPGVKLACDEFLQDKGYLQFWDDYVGIYQF